METIHANLNNDGVSKILSFIRFIKFREDIFFFTM